jgi:hypothetical protein
VPSCPAGSSVSDHALTALSTALRRSRNQSWAPDSADSPAGRQALLVITGLDKGETYTHLVAGFEIGLTTVFRSIREAVDTLAAQALTPEQAIVIATRKAAPVRP